MLTSLPPLRPYQQRVFDSIISSDRAATSDSGIVSAPTGCGKSLIMAYLYRHWTEVEGLSVLVVCWELSVRAALATRYGVPCAVSPSSRAVSDALEGRSVKPDIVIIDEVHHYDATEEGAEAHAWHKIYDLPRTRWIGFSATPLDIDLVRWRISYSELRADGWIPTADRLSAVVCTSLSEALAATDQPDTYCVTYISEQKQYSPDMGRLILADTPTEERCFRRKEDGSREHRLCCIGTLTTGWDDPDVNAVILARRIAEPQTFLQIIGRLRRGGTICDLSSNIVRFGLDEDAIVSSLNRKGVSSGDGVPVLIQCSACERLVSPRIDVCPYCGATLPPRAPSSRFWQRLTPERITRILKEFKSLDWQCKPTHACSFTHSGAWPHQMRDFGTGPECTFYFSPRTYDFYRHVRDRLESLQHTDGVVYNSGLWLLLRDPTVSTPEVYACSLEYGSNLKWRRV